MNRPRPESPLHDTLRKQQQKRSVQQWYQPRQPAEMREADKKIPDIDGNQRQMKDQYHHKKCQYPVGQPVLPLPHEQYCKDDSLQQTGKKNGKQNETHWMVLGREDNDFRIASVRYLTDG